MSRMVLADTGPLYAADRGEAHHSQAQQELKRLARESRTVAVAYPTLLEAYTLMLISSRPAARLELAERYPGRCYLAVCASVFPSREYPHRAPPEARTGI
jgi:hypothetical protein